MTVSTQTTKVTINGNGSATSLSFKPLVIFKAGEIVVTHVDASDVETVIPEGTGASKYALDVASFPGTGSITYPEDKVTPLPSGERIIVKRVLTVEQPLDLENQSAYFADTQEEQLDKLVMLDLQQQELLDRSIKFPVTYAGSVAALMVGIPVADRYLRINAAGTALEWAAISTATASASDATPATNKDAAGTAGTGTDFSRDDHRHKVDNVWTVTQEWAKGADVASASSMTLGTDGNYFDITGTTGITSIATIGVGTIVLLHFDGALTLTHHATNLVLPGGEDILTAAGDEGIFVEYNGGDWRLVSWTSGTTSWVKGADVSSAADLDVAKDGNYFDVTGTVTITTIKSKGVGTVLFLHFDGALTFTHHATNLILPGAANITTAAGDEAVLVEYASADWRCISYQVAADSPGSTVDVQTFTSSGTWTKPSTGSIAIVECWGGGASGGKSATTAFGGGGGGGAYARAVFTIADLGATETVTIGAGGAAQASANTAGNAGGNTTLGSLLTAYGGAGGGATSVEGGGAGSPLAAGSTGLAGKPGSQTADGDDWAGGAGGTQGGTNAGGIGGVGGGGGGGGGPGGGTAGAGGKSKFGGGGGGGGENTAGTEGAGGTSELGGDGGAGNVNDAAAGTAGTQPSGGGGGSNAGSSGAGGAGQCIVRVL